MKKKHILGLATLLVLLTVTILLVVKFGFNETLKETPKKAFIASSGEEVILYDSEYKESLKLTRGSNVYVYSSEIKNEEEVYKKIKYNDNEYLVKLNNVVLRECS